MMHFGLIPHSRATNSYDLLLDVIQVIDEEPKRFNWGEWNLEASDDPDLSPACGTLACVAGWTSLITAPTLEEGVNPIGSYGADALQWFPYHTRRDLNQVFYATYSNGPTDACPYDHHMDRFLGETQRQYADRGIRSIRAFMAAHEQALKAHTITIPERTA